MVPAVHSSGFDPGDGKLVYAGTPVGFVIQISQRPDHLTTPATPTRSFTT